MRDQTAPTTHAGLRSIWERTGAAPISWGVCEVPGWGLQLPVDRVLGDMNQLGFRSTELGSIGYLPEDPVVLCAVLARHELSLTGGFVALALHAEAQVEETRRRAIEAADLLSAGGASSFVTCAVSDPDNWERPVISEREWERFGATLREIDDICSRRGLVQVSTAMSIPSSKLQTRSTVSSPRPT